MNADQLFRAMVEQQASDLFLKVGARPFLRVRGQLAPVGEQRCNRADVMQLAYDLMGPDRQLLFQQQRELNFAFEREAIGRFRANVMWQRGNLALVVRRVDERILSFEELHLPAGVFKRLATERQGLILITGPTGNGKSTTAAAIIEYINQTQAKHIITLEDPIEFVFEERQSVISQREVGVDTKSFSEGLKNVLRQSSDVLFLSDIRDRETMESVLLAAEAGQLVVSCIHTTNVVNTIERIVAIFPPHQHASIRFRLSLALRGIICMRLLPRLPAVPPAQAGQSAPGLAPAVEILVMTPTIREYLREGKTERIPTLLADGALYGMQTRTQALYQLIKRGEVSVEEAMKVADSPGELELAVQEIRTTQDSANPKGAPRV